jgi:hypothetical protein
MRKQAQPDASTGWVFVFRARNSAEMPIGREYPLKL